MKWINAEQQVTVTIYDEEHEEHLVKTMTVKEMLDTYANEGCPTIYSKPERKKGKWIWWYEEEFTEHATEYTPHCKCSECGRECAPSVATSSNFCRNCGADMRGKENE